MRIEGDEVLRLRGTTTYEPAPADRLRFQRTPLDWSRPQPTSVLGRMWERIFGDEANQDRRPEPIDGECPNRCAEDQADVSVDFRLRANRRNPCLEMSSCSRSSTVGHARVSYSELQGIAVAIHKHFCLNLFLLTGCLFWLTSFKHIS